MLNLYEMTVPALTRALTNLAANLKKGQKYANDMKIEQSVLLQARLFVDMYPLTRQVQIATDMSKGAVARLAGIEIPTYEDNELTFEDLNARIDKTIAFIASIKPSQLDGAQTREINITVRNTKLTFNGKDYVLGWVMPNVYFHCTTAYNIMRHNGVALGKPDFLGAIQ